MRPRIIFLNPIGGIGGAERILLATAKHLQQHADRLAVSAVLLGPGPLQAALEAYGVTVYVLPLSDDAAELGDTKLRGRSKLQRLATLAASGFFAGPSLLRFTRKLRMLFNALRPNLIHSNGLKTHLLGTLAAPDGVPVLWHVHDFYSQRPLMANVLRKLAHKARHAIAISRAVQADIGRELPGLASTLIYNGIDTERFAPDPGDPAALDILAGLAPKECVRVGLVATYANWKGHDVFLRAIAKLPKNEARFYIVGGPIYSTLGSQFSRENLEALAASLGIADRVGFVPFQSEPAAVYRSLDVVVHASTRPEPFGLTIVEAMACGRAVVVADAGGASELFTDGVDALGHVPGDADSLATAIRSAIEDPARRSSLGQQARRTAVERFSDRRFGEETDALYAGFLPPVHRRVQDARPARVTVPSPSGDLHALAVPKRIVYLNPIGGIGGAERSLLRILGVMKRFAPEVKCHLLVGSEGPLIERARALGVQVELFPLDHAIRRFGESGLRGGGLRRSRMQFALSLPRVSIESLKTRRWLGDWLAHHKPDLIHSNGLKTHLLSGLVKPLGTPLLWHVRDFLRGRPVMHWSLRWLAPQATMAVANSKAVAADARFIFGGLPVATLYNSVDTTHFYRAPRDPQKLAERAGLPPTSPETILIGLVATYANWKGHDVLLKAAARLPRDIPFRIYLVGEPIYATPGSQFTRAELESLATELGLRDRVGFIPFQPDTADIYRKLDIVVHASTRPEPFGLTIAEAMACGKPVIVSAGGGARELFTDGHDALGHPPGDVAALATVLRQLIADPGLRERLGTNARATAEARYAEESFARELLAIYSQCLSLAK